MPYSYRGFDPDVAAWVWQHVPPLAPILDAGAGAGKYAKLLRSTHPNIEALEFHEPYIAKYELAKLYRLARHGDIRAFDTAPYALVILGDVLEHLSICEGQAVVARIACPIIVQVPFLAPQQPCYGNEAERHCQPDLSHEVMAARYPRLKPLVPPHPTMGVYIGEALA